jgi:hypothetical protein
LSENLALQVLISILKASILMMAFWEQQLWVWQSIIFIMKKTKKSGHRVVSASTPRVASQNSF